MLVVYKIPAMLRVEGIWWMLFVARTRKRSASLFDIHVFIFLLNEKEELNESK